MTSCYQKFLEDFSCAHVSDGFMDGDGERMLGYLMNLQGSPLLKVKELKDRGNGFFRQNCFDRAAACYDEGCKLLSLSMGVVGGEDAQSLSDLAVSLNSNLAACALKLEEFHATLDLCSMILHSFPRNVKALFRRALVFMKLKRFSEAKLDLVEALGVEPKNKDVLRELEVVKNQLLMKENGKRVLENTPTVDVDRTKKIAHVSETCMSIKDSEKVKMEVTGTQNNHGMGTDKSIKVNERVVVEMTDARNICGMDMDTSFKTNEYVFDESSMLEFSKKGEGKFRLRVRGQSYQKLLEGKKVSFYHKRDLSTITIRILNNEITKEKDISKVMCKKKKKKKKAKRRRRKRKFKAMTLMNEDMSPLDMNNVKPPVPDASLSTSSICDNVIPSGSQVLKVPSNTVVSQESSLPVSSTIDDASSICTHAHSDDHRPFLFSACSKKGKILCASSMSRCRYPFKRHENYKRRMLTSKKNFSRGEESPRHNFSTFSKSRSFTHNFLRPRGVSVSCCRYSSEARLMKKRKEMFDPLASSGRPLKKSTLISTPTLSLISKSHNVIIKSDSESRRCMV